MGIVDGRSSCVNCGGDMGYCPDEQAGNTVCDLCQLEEQAVIAGQLVDYPELPARFPAVDQLGLDQVLGGRS